MGPSDAVTWDACSDVGQSPVGPFDRANGPRAMDRNAVEHRSPLLVSSWALPTRDLPVRSRHLGRFLGTG